MMHTTGLKLSVLTLASIPLETVSANLYAQLGVGGLIALALIYVYRDMRSVHAEKERLLTAHNENIQKIMSEHKDDVKEIIKEQSIASSAVAKIAAEASARSSEVMRDNVQIMVEVKDVIKANTAAVIWCRDSALARRKNE